MTLLAELKRRKVFKVGGAYLVVAWLLIQVVATVAPQLNLPEWAPRLITFVILLGFPVALVLAWVLESTSEGVKLESARAGNAPVYAFSAALAALALAWYFLGQPAHRDGEAQDPAAAQPPERSIAVLAFTSLSDDKENEYLADGVSEEILNALAQLRELKVAGRTSSFHFKGRNEDLRAIGRTLGVAHVLEGSVRRQGERVRITAQLIQVSDGFHLWSETYDGEMGDVFELQERVARAVSDALKIELSDAQQAQLVDVGTSDPEAYATYLKAAAAYRRRDSDLYPDAIARLEQALVLDPRFARAAAMIGRMQQSLADDEVPGHPAAVEAKRRAEQALALDSRLSLPHVTLGLIALREWRLLDARSAFERAVELAPGDADAAFFRARHLLHTGYLAAGIAALDRVLVLDPALPNALWRRALAYLDAGDFEAAEWAAARARDLGLAWADDAPRELAEARGDWPEARRVMAKSVYAEDCLRDPAADSRTIDAGMYGGSAGERAAALAVIEACLASPPAVMSDTIPIALMRIGEPARALDAIALRPSTSQPRTLNTLWGPVGREARRLPQFAAFAREHGFVDVWERHGPPDLCRRLTPGEYACD